MESHESDIVNTYGIYKRKWESNLKDLGVELVNLRVKGELTKNAIVLCFLIRHMPRPVTKEQLTSFVRKFYPDTSDVQQARHLGRQKGYYILSSRRNDKGTESWPKDSYALITLEDKYPGYNSTIRDNVLSPSAWEQIKKSFGYRCATCGSERGKPNLRNQRVITKLQQGHRDPSKSMAGGNCIPQCDECNRASRDQWIWDSRGRPYAINSPSLIERSPRAVQKQIFEILRKKFHDLPDSI